MNAKTTRGARSANAIGYGTLRRFLIAILVLSGLATVNHVSAQTNLCTTHSQNNGASSITFNVQNTNGYPISVNSVSCYIGSGSQAIQLLYNTSPCASSGSTWTQGIIGAGQNGWVSAYSGTQTIATAGVNVLSNTLNIIIPPGATYGFAISSNSVSYMTLTAGAGVNTFSNSGVNILTGDNISWGGGTYPATPVNYPRGFHGCISFVPVGPCTDPPIAGTATSTVSSMCVGQSAVLGITGGTGGTGQTYQWMSSSVSGGPYTNIGSASPAPNYTVTPTSPTYYVCEVTCGASSSTSSEVSIFVPTPFPGGNYTINNLVPTGGNNFNSFAAAVSAISCGIAGPVVFDVDPSSGPYTEQITLPATIGANAVNTVTFNGNGRTLQFNSTNASARHIIKLDGADYITFNELVIDGSAAAATYAWGVHFINGADYNTFNLCTIKTSKTNTTSGNHYPVVMSSSITSPTAAGNSGNNNTFQDNTFIGGYYGASVCGIGAGAEINANYFANNIFQDYYSYGIYNIYVKNGSYLGNDFSRPTRTNSTTVAGIYMTTSGPGNVIENNRIHDLFAAFTAASTSTMYGIFCAAAGTVAQPTRIVNNMVYNINGLYNGGAYGIYNSGASNMNCWHNTIALDNTTQTAGLAYGFYQTGLATNVSVRNNMITLARTGTGAKVGLYYATTTSSITSNNNVVYVAGTGTGTRNFGNYGGTNYATLANWQTANGGAYDANSVSASPAYTNPAAGDLTPTAVATNNVGANLGVVYDIIGNPRSVVAPDAGAFEYSLPGLDASLTWVSPTSPTTAGLKTITVNVINNLANTINSITLNYTDGVNPPVSETFSSLTLTGGSSQSFSFTTQYNLTASATLRAYISDVNGISDDNQANDSTALVPLCLSLAGAYTINSALPTGSGNFQSFNALAAALNCGGIAGPVTVDVVTGSGPYTNQATFNQVSGSSAVNTITINGNGETVNYNATGDYHTIRLNGIDYLTVNNLNIATTGTTNGFALLVSNNSDYNTFNNCTFTVPQSVTSTGSSAVAFSASTTSPTTTGNNGNYNTFNSCTMRGGYYCVSVYGNSAAPGNILGNQFLNCSITDFYVYGLYNAYAGTTVVRGCIIDRPTRTSLSTGYGVYLTTNSVNCLVQDNKIRKMFGAVPSATNTSYLLGCAASATAGNENKFINNVVSDIESNAAMYGIYLTGANFVQAYHNTIVLNDAASTATATTYGIYSSGTTGIDLRNNIVSVTRGGTGTKYCLYYTNAAGLTSDNNDLYMNAAGTTNYIAYNGTANYATLAAYQSGNPTKDQLSVSINPNFNNPALFDYKPTEVTLNDLGVNVGVAQDITGAVRGTIPDMGAYEFSVAPTDIGLFTFNQPAAGGCYSPSQDVDVSIKNFGSAILDFSVNPVTVSCDVNGPVSSTLTYTVNTGTLAPGATMNVVLGPAFNMTANGTYTFGNIYTSMPGDGNATNDYLVGAVSRTVGVIAGTLSSSFTSACISTPPPVLTLSGSYGGAIQWQVSTTSASGPWTNVGTGATTYTPASLTQTSWFQAEVSCNGNVATSNVINVIVNAPAIATTTPGSRCGTGSVVLGATAPGYNVKWYANPTGGAAIDTGTVFNTPTISTTTTFYAEAVSGAGSFTGLGCTQVPTSSGFNAKRGIQFDAYQSFTLNSFDFYAAYAGTTTMTVELSNSAGTVLQTMSVSEVSANAAAGWHTVTLNMLIPAGTGLRLQCQFLTGSLSNYSHSSGANYASPTFNYLGGVGLITAGLDNGPVISPTTYWYFYNLAISAGCNSLREPVVASVVAPPSVTVSPSTAICVGQSTNLTVTSSNGGYSYVWTPGNLPGNSVSVSPASTTIYTLTATDNSGGTYNSCATEGVSTVTVNPVPTPVTVTPGNPSVCSGNIQQLTAGGGTIGGLYQVGTGTGTTSTMGTTPYGSFYESERVQYIIRASELAALGMVSGNISSMAFNVVTAGAWAQTGFTIKMASTAANAFSGAYATPTGTFATVFGPSLQPIPPTGWNTYSFSSPFFWDGVSNILIEICHDNDNPGNTCGICYGTSSTVSTTTTSFNSVYGTYNDNATLCGTGLGTLVTTDFTSRPNIIFNSASPTNITWSPVTDLYTNSGASTAYTGAPSTYTVYTKPTASTLYTVTATTTNGCTATNTVNVSLLPTSSSTTAVSQCAPPYVWNGNTYTASGTYTYTATGSNGCDSVATLNLVIAPCNTNLNLTAFIQAYWDGTSAMNPTLFNQGQANPNTDCDSITVELHEAAVPTTIAYSTTAVLQTNGTATCIFPPVANGNYYIVLKHRNAIETWSADSIAFTGGNVSYNFSTAATQAYGSNQAELTTGGLPNGIFALYSGDIVKDSGEATDLLDLTQLEFEINNFSFGYYAEDLNGDGNVDILDAPTLEGNISGFIYSNHP